MFFCLGIDLLYKRRFLRNVNCSIFTQIENQPVYRLIVYPLIIFFDMNPSLNHRKNLSPDAINTSNISPVGDAPSITSAPSASSISAKTEASPKLVRFHLLLGGFDVR